MRQPILAAGVAVDLDRWNTACAGDMTAFASVELVVEDETIATLGVSGGSVSEDRSALHRSSAEVELVGPFPDVGVDGWEFRVWRGVLLDPYRFNSREWATTPVAPSTLYQTTLDAAVGFVNLGTFAVQTVRRDMFGNVTLEGIDRSQWLSDARLEDAWPWAASGTLEDAVASFVGNRWRWDVPMVFAGDTHPRPKAVHERESDPWEIITDAAASVGYEVFFDGSTLIWQPEPDASTATPSFELHEGGGQLIDLAAIETREGVYNSVTAYTTDPEAAATWSARVYDNDPQSKTYYLGRFGRKPAFYGSPLIKSGAQASAAARTRMFTMRAPARTVEFTMVPNPAMQTSDVVSYRCLAAGVDDVAVVDELVHPLSPGEAMSGRSFLRTAS